MEEIVSLKLGEMMGWKYRAPVGRVKCWWMERSRVHTSAALKGLAGHWFSLSALELWDTCQACKSQVWGIMREACSAVWLMKSESLEEFRDEGYKGLEAVSGRVTPPSASSTDDFERAVFQWGIISLTFVPFLSPVNRVMLDVIAWGFLRSSVILLWSMLHQGH